ncbi:MAG: hypothetical protein HYZ47_02315 [Simkania negevensis]|nr:hypothetical protein [Simkania negevensis]
MVSHLLDSRSKKLLTKNSATSASLFKKLLEKNLKNDLLVPDVRLLAMRDFFLESLTSEESLLSWISEIGKKESSNPYHYLDLWREVLSILCLWKKRGLSCAPKSSFVTDCVITAACKKMVNSVLTSGFWKEFQLSSAFAALASFLLGEDKRPYLKQMGNGIALLETGDHFLDGATLDPTLLAELYVLWIYLAFLLKEESLLIAGLRGGYFLLSLCDQEGLPFQALWTKEEKYHPIYRSLLYFHLFTLTAHCTQDPKMDGAAEKLYMELEQEAISSKIDLNSLSFLYPLLASVFSLEEMSPFCSIDEPFALTELSRPLSFMKVEFLRYDFVGTASGVNTGLFTLHKKNLKIINFGPQFFPLSDPSRFGLYRTADQTSTPFTDLLMEKKEGNFRFKGWSRLVDPERSLARNISFSSAFPGKEWIYFDLCGGQKEITLSTQFFHRKDSIPLYLVFYVSSDQLHVGGGEDLFPKSLQRYKGKALPIILQKEEEKLELISMMEGEMELIPLGGYRHFWGADFLISFPIMPSLSNYSWKIIL